MAMEWGRSDGEDESSMLRCVHSRGMFKRHYLLLAVRKGVWNQGQTSSKDGIGTAGR